MQYFFHQLYVVYINPWNEHNSHLSGCTKGPKRKQERIVFRNKPISFSSGSKKCMCRYQYVDIDICIYLYIYIYTHTCTKCWQSASLWDSHNWKISNCLSWYSLHFVSTWIHVGSSQWGRPSEVKSKSPVVWAKVIHGVWSIPMVWWFRWISAKFNRCYLKEKKTNHLHPWCHSSFRLATPRFGFRVVVLKCCSPVSQHLNGTNISIFQDRPQVNLSKIIAQSVS